jgi:hypothetical protein
MGFMRRTATTFCLALVAVTIGGCNPFDPPLYETPLPNGLYHYSNGGEFGGFGTEFVDGSSTVVYPLENDWFCNEFAIIGDDVFGKEIVYAHRAFVDPPKRTRWFYLNTKDRTATTFDTFDALLDHCKSLGHAEVPPLVGRTSETREMDF